MMRIRLVVLLMMGLLLFPSLVHAQQPTIPEPFPPWYKPKSPDLTQELISGNGAITVYHPAGWITFAEENQLTFASRDVVLNSSFPFNLQRDDDFRAGVFVLEYDLSREDETQTLNTLVNTFVELANRDRRFSFSFNDPEAVDLNGRSALVIVGESDDADQVFIAVSLENGYYAAVLFFTAPGNSKHFVDLAEAIAGKMEYLPSASSPEDHLFEA